VQFFDKSFRRLGVKRVYLDLQQGILIVDVISPGRVILVEGQANSSQLNLVFTGLLDLLQWLLTVVFNLLLQCDDGLAVLLLSVDIHLLLLFHLIFQGDCLPS